MSEQFVLENLNQVVEALIERGYNPYSQLKGYIITGSLLYITSNRKARSIIKMVNINSIEYYLNNWEKYQDKKWHLEYIQEIKK